MTHAAGPVDPTSLQTGIVRLGSAGIDVDRNPRLGAPGTDQPFLAGSDRARSRDLVHALTAPGYDAIIAARGGYGSMRLLDRLPDGLLFDAPRWLVGYSDITALHLWAFDQGVATIHGPMAAGLAKEDGPASLDSLLAALRGEPSRLVVRGQGRVSGRLVGGNLSLLAALRPTRFWPSLDGCILFIEEVGEPLYRIDRALETLRLAGGLERAAGFVVGQCTACGSGDAGSAAAVELIRGRLAPLGRPVLLGAESGHGLPNLSFVHGARYELRSGALCYAEGTPKTGAPASRRQVGAVELLLRAVDSGVCSGAQLVVSLSGEVVRTESVGHLSDTGATAVTEATPFDLASVTKAVSTAVLAHLAIEEGRVGLDDRCSGAISVSKPTLRDLLRHSSGLPAHVEVFRAARAASDSGSTALEAFTDISATEHGPLYSDVGYVALGRWIAELFGQPLDELFRERIADPLGIGITFGPVQGAAETEECAHRGEVLRGVVHDENAQVLGAVAGHAGLFGSARDVDVLARSLLGFGPTILAPTSVARMWDPAERPADGTYTLGWDTPSGPRSNAGSLMHREATVGHLGFTGTSLWVDRKRELAITLLTNRVHPSRENAGIRWLRPAIHDSVVRETE